MTEPGLIRVLLVDDHPVVRMGLHAIEAVDPAIRIVGEASTAESAWTRIQTSEPDVVLLDMRLPDGDGADVCRLAKSAFPRLRVICLTSYTDPSLVLAALGAGADGYLLKHNDAERIAASIHAALRGEQVLDELLETSPAHHGQATSNPPDPLAVLSPGERRVLAEVAKGLTDKEVSVVLCLSVKTVRNSLDRAFDKLKVHSRTQAAMLYATHGGSRLA